MNSFAFTGLQSRSVVHPPDATHLRSGMFVRDTLNEAVAILTHHRRLRDAFNPQWGWCDQWELHYLSTDGVTVLVAPLGEGRSMNGLRQARLDEIPVSRRPKEHVAKEFGYT
jgi:hypothetical protein